MLRFQITDDIPGLAVALVEIFDVQIAPAPEGLQHVVEHAVEHVVAHGWPEGERRSQEIRQLLRAGGFKPSGRNKPAQEYLLRSATQDGALPSIFNVVDLLNAISLQSGIPISLVSLDRVGTNLSLRWGKPGETYVFNQAGQELDVKGLLCVCMEDDGSSLPVGSPVKDSMRAKVTAEDHHLLALFYASRNTISSEELQRWALQLGNGAVQYCGAERYEVMLLPEGDWSPEES